MLDMRPGHSPADLPGNLPPDLITADIDPDSLKTTAVGLLQSLNEDALIEGAFWKDWIALTGRTRTTQGRDNILDLWKQAASKKQISNIKPTTARVIRPCPDTSWVTVTVTFTTTFTYPANLSATNTANICLTPTSPGTYQIWLLTTILESFTSYPNPDTPPSPSLSPSSLLCSPSLDYAVVVIGAGQSGLSLCGRLRALHIKALLIDIAPTIGAAWTSKYDTVRQHTLREYNNLPFDRTWKPSDPDLLPGSIVAEGFTGYVKRYGLEVWLRSRVTRCERDDRTDMWILDVVTTDAVSGEEGETRQVRCRHLAPALGAGVSAPVMPDLPPAKTFEGEVMHQSAFRNGKPYQGKYCVVVGTGTTGHDITQSLLDWGAARVTMVQRSPTSIYPIDWVCDSQRGLYNTEVPTGVADRLGATSPGRVACEIIRRMYQGRSREVGYRELVSGLEGRGFRVKEDYDMLGMIWGRYGGYYIDVGTCGEVVKGRVRVRRVEELEGLEGAEVVWRDGERERCDLVVCATGYETDYRRQVERLVGEEGVKGVSEFWGLDSNGDVRGVMTEARRGLWLLGGTAPNARWWSRFVALLMQAELMGWDVGLGDEKRNGLRSGAVNGVNGLSGVNGVNGH